MLLLSILSTRRTGSLIFISSVTFIPYTILSTASPRCCCTRFSADTSCGRRAAAARVDATAAPDATPLLRSNAAVVRVNRARIVLTRRQRAEELDSLILSRLQWGFLIVIFTGGGGVYPADDRAPGTGHITYNGRHKAGVCRSRTDMDGRRSG